MALPEYPVVIALATFTIGMLFVRETKDSAVYHEVEALSAEFTPTPEWRGGGTETSLRAMELFGSYTSPYVRHCRIVLLETGISCTHVETDAVGAATKTPTMRVPFLQDGDQMLTDSASICRYLREKVGQPFLPRVADQELFSLAGTVLDTGINLFLFERHDGLLPEKSKYLTKQATRLVTGLRALNESLLPEVTPLGDAGLRLACLLAWGRFRERFTIEDLPKLQKFLALADDYEPFARTSPPVGAPPPA